MLQARVICPLGLGLALIAVLAACGGGPIEKNVVRPGITAMEQASALACSSDAETLGQAIQSYTMLESKAPADEASLVAAHYLKSESTLYDVVDGQIVPVDPGCGSTGSVPPSGSQPTPVSAPSTDLGEIVTSTEAPLTPDQMVAELTDDEIAQVGGVNCVRELVTIYAAAESYVAEQGKDPTTIDDLVSGGYLDQPATLWVVENDELVPAPGSGCISLGDAYDASTCIEAARNLAIARETWLIDHPGIEPTQHDLLAADSIYDIYVSVDLIGGAVVAVPGGPCDGVDLGL